VKNLIKTYIKEYLLNLEEGLIKSVNIGQAVNILKKQFPNWIFQYDNGDKDFTIEILKSKEPIKYEYLEKLLPLLNNLGYFISYVEIYGDNIKIKDKYNGKIIKNSFNNPDVHSIYLECEAKFDQTVNKIPNILYHITPLQNWDKIQKMGLTPKSRSKRSFHPDRVYLGKDIKNLTKLSKEFYLDTGLKEFALLKIETTLIPGNYFKLYYDPNYKFGYFTLNNIPPQAIEKIDIIKI
jgi:hypothetical protein